MAWHRFHLRIRKITWKRREEEEQDERDKERKGDFLLIISLVGKLAPFILGDAE